MKPVFQTRFGYPHGNCFAACVATLLERKIEEVWEGDDLDATMQDNRAWWSGWRTWLNSQGYDLVHVNDGAWFMPPKGYAIANGIAKNGEVRHAVIVLDGKLIHDPHPGWKGLKKVESYVVIYPTRLAMVPNGSG